MSYLTPAEVDAIQHLPRDTPYLIAGVMNTQLSIARFYGGIKYNGAHYAYMPATDELVRWDVVKYIAKQRKREAALRKLNKASDQMGMEL